MVKLIIEDDEGKTTVVPLIRDEITIGRKEGNTIRLTERNVSRKHAKLIKQNGAIFIEDLASYNGIKVNGNKVSGRVAITEGDRIQIGDYVLGLKLEGTAAAADDPFAAAKTKELSRVEDAPTGMLDVRDARGAAEDGDEAGAAAAGADTTIENPSRLVCVSANFAGEDWAMARPVMVIGRTEDNDVVINHRSISRHHARITCENGRHTILDLQSANGVRINGEEYGKVELRKGDLVDLGHVRLRFVAHDEDFVFDRDAEIVDISKPSSSRGLIWAVLSGLAVVAIALVIWRFAGSDGPTPQPKLSPKPAPIPTAIKDSSPDSAVTSATPPVAPEVDETQLLAKISRAISSEQWQEAVDACGKLTETAQQTAKANCDKAKLEQKAKDAFEKFNSAAARNAYAEAIQAYGKIPAESVYKAKDAERVKDVKAKYLAQAQTSLGELIGKKECDKAKALAAEIKAVDATTGAEDKANKCGEAQVTLATKDTPRPVRKDRPRVPRTPRKDRPRQPIKKQPTPPVVAAKKSGPTMEDLQKSKELTDKARDRYLNADYKPAIRYARQALKHVPKNAAAIQIIGASSCFLKDVKGVKWAAKRLPPRKRNLLKRVCERNNVSID